MGFLGQILAHPILLPCGLLFLRLIGHALLPTACFFTTLLCLLAKIKCSICSYRLNRSIRSQCELYRLVNFYGTRMSGGLLPALHVVHGIALKPCDDRPFGHFSHLTSYYHSYIHPIHIYHITLIRILLVDCTHIYHHLLFFHKL